MRGATKRSKEQAKSKAAVKTGRKSFAQRVQWDARKLAMAGQGRSPCASRGISKGGILFRKEYPPFCESRRASRGTPAAFAAKRFYELGASMMHCPSGIPEPVGSESFWYDWGCVGGALERCEGAYHEVIVERAAVALVTKILAHLLENKKVYAAMQWIMHFYLALVLFGNHALDDDEVFKDIVKQIG